MKTVVYGAGSIGCYIGAILHKQGVQVALLGRQRIKDTIEANGGISITDYEGRKDKVTGLNFVTSPDVLSDADIVLITLKCTALPSAIEEIKAHCSASALIVCLQNGVGAVEQLKASLPEHNLTAGIVPFNVVQTDAHFHRATDGSLHFPDHELMLPIQNAYKTYGLDCQLHASKAMQSVVWGKLLLNLNNAINALSNIPLKEELEQRGYRRVLADCQQELMDACAKADIELAKLTAVKPKFLPYVLRLPDFLFKRIAQRMLAIDPQARSSMWEDLQHGRSTEVAFLNGAVVNLANQVCLDAPVNAKVLSLIQSLSPGEVPTMTAAQLGEAVYDA